MSPCDVNNNKWFHSYGSCKPILNIVTCQNYVYVSWFFFNHECAYFSSLTLDQDTVKSLVLHFFTSFQPPKNQNLTKTFVEGTKTFVESIWTSQHWICKTKPRNNLKKRYLRNKLSTKGKMFTVLNWPTYPVSELSRNKQTLGF